MKRMLTLICILTAPFAVRAEAADLTGRFVFGGPVPAPMKLNIDKDVEAFGNLGLVDETLAVAPDGGIANVVIWVRTEGVAVPADVEAAVPKKVEYDNKGGRFVPRILPVWVGKQTLVIKNTDPVSHNSNLQPPGNEPINPLLTPNTSVDYNFAMKTLLPTPVGCNIHPWMKGFIVPRDNPYCAVSGTDGKFTIKGLPTGTELEFQVWQEKAGYLLAKPEWTYVDEAGRKRDGRFKLTFTGNVDLGEIKVDPALFNK
jgi:hypothetical protein